MREIREVSDHAVVASGIAIERTGMDRGGGARLGKGSRGQKAEGGGEVR